MKYQIRKGQEHKFAITENISDKEEFLYPAFSRALYALEKIVTNAENFESNSDIELYGYSQNIIAFSGVRGMGKTSAMVSLSRAMEAGNLPDNFKSCRFVVLPPVDPTIMEKHQNIIKLLLSRMYRLAEETWRNAERTHCRNVTDTKKNNLLTLFNDCISSLDAIKNVDSLSASNLSAISKISDSSILKQQLYNLVEAILAFTKKQDNGRDFLVIQLDDTDTSTSKCYEILEDLRKFLSIPNVIILMATDMKLLRTVILQHYIDEFASSREAETVSITHLEKMESKYIDKIIPPTNAIHLPKLDDCIVNYSDTLRLSYIDASGTSNLLFTSQDTDNPEQYLSAQELILRYIYRKTGIVFVASSCYHSIIPTTLRGLSQFLEVLSTMEDIPQVTDFYDQERFNMSIQQYIEVSDININRFEKYFLNEWAEAKLSQKQVAIITDVVNADPKSRLIYIADSVADIYNAERKVDDDKNTSNAGRKRLHNVKDFESFVDFMDNFEKNYRQAADVYFFFAIKTCLTILYHKTALFKMKEAVSQRQESSRLIFDFSPDKTLFPDVFVVPNMRGKGSNKEIIFYDIKHPKEVANDDKKLKAILNNLYRQHYVRNNTVAKCFALTNLIALALSLGDDVFSKEFSQIDQKWLFDVQMSALTISINFDLHKTVSLAIDNYTPKQYKLKIPERIDEFFDWLDKTINRTNKNKQTAPPMLNSNLLYLRDFVNGAQHEQIRAIIGDITNEIENTEEINVDKMCDLYKMAIEISNDLQKDINEMTRTKIAKITSDANVLYFADYPGQALFDADLVSRLNLGVYARKYFMRDFIPRFELLCRTYYVNCDDAKVKAEAKE